MKDQGIAAKAGRCPVSTQCLRPARNPLTPAFHFLRTRSESISLSTGPNFTLRPTEGTRRQGSRSGRAAPPTLRRDAACVPPGFAGRG